MMMPTSLCMLLMLATIAGASSSEARAAHSTQPAIVSADEIGQASEPGIGATMVAEVAAHTHTSLAESDSAQSSTSHSESKRASRRRRRSGTPRRRSDRRRAPPTPAPERRRRTRRRRRTHAECKKGDKVKIGSEEHDHKDAEIKSLNDDGTISISVTSKFKPSEVTKGGLPCKQHEYSDNDNDNDEPPARRRGAPRRRSPWKAPQCWKPTPKGQNPFKAQTYYVNPSYRELLDSSIKTASGNVKSTLKKMKNVPSAFWIDVKSKVYKGKPNPDINTVQGILEDAAKCDPPHLVLFMVYDLPNRDCWALASNGEICCHYGKDVGRTKCEMGSNGFYKEYPGAGCKDGLKEYRETYIDPFAKVVKSFDGKVPIVLVIEPDSLPNMVTNMKDQRPEKFRGCNDESKAAYMDGITYAVDKFSGTDASIYLDAGHGGWLGWANPDYNGGPPNNDKVLTFMKLIASMGIHTKMRGFATNVANYQPIGVERCSKTGKLGTCIPQQKNSDKCCSFDPCKLGKQWNWGHTEVNYVDVVTDRAKKAMPGWDVRFIVDTGRNGAPGARTSCSNWCNPRGNGIGRVPQWNTGHEKIDAYYWLKTPGESDGCTEKTPDGKKCQRFDEMCASDDSIGSKAGEPRAPEAGLWFDHQIKDLAENADLGDPWWVDMYDKGLQCRGKDGGCADPMPQPSLMQTYNFSHA